MRDEQIIQRYKNGDYPTNIAKDYGISDRQVQRILKKAGASRTQSESYRLAIKQGRMKYYHKPEHLKVHRKTITTKLRYYILERDNHTCQSCGSTIRDGVRIEIDHINNDATNNDPHNLQVLCNLCNQGKSQSVQVHNKHLE